jgi:alkylhydroperoxidase family enzyme
MAWITEIGPEDATGLLKKELDKAIARAGRVWKIVQVMSVNPNVLRASMNHYIAIMHGPSPLTRFQRELLGTTVSCALQCRY